MSYKSRDAEYGGIWCFGFMVFRPSNVQMANLLPYHLKVMEAFNGCTKVSNSYLGGQTLPYRLGTRRKSEKSRIIVAPSTLARS